MNHFKGVNEQERYSNDVLNEMRKQTELLEQIAQLLQPQTQGGNKSVPNNRSKRNTSSSSHAK